MEDLHRLVIAVGGGAILCFLALITWIAVRLDQGVRLLRPPPAPPPPLPCKRLHVSDLAWYQRVPGVQREDPFMTDLELPAFRADTSPAVDIDEPRRPTPRRPVDEDEVNPTFPVVRPKR